MQRSRVFPVAAHLNGKNKPRLLARARWFDMVGYLQNL
jgi:hypothetical protein